MEIISDIESNLRMAKKSNAYKEYKIATQAIHTGTDYDEVTGAVRRPLHMANSCRLPDDLSQINYSSTDSQIILLHLLTTKNHCILVQIL